MAHPLLWIEAARPKTLIASISPILIGTAYGIHQGFFNLGVFLCTLLTGIAIQIGTNLANDLFDGLKKTDTPDRIGPVRLTGSNLVLPKTMGWAVFFTFFLAFLSSLVLIQIGGILVFFLFLLALVLGIGYTAGPIPLGYLGLGDFFVLIFFGLVATGMSSYLQVGFLDPKAFLLGLAPGALSTCILIITSLRDRITDTKVSKKTLVVRFGEKFGKLEYAFMLILSLLIPPLFALYCGSDVRNIALLAFIIPAIPLIRGIFKASTPHEFIPFLPKTSLFYILYTLIFSYTLML